MVRAVWELETYWRFRSLQSKLLQVSEGFIIKTSASLQVIYCGLHLPVYPTSEYLPYIRIHWLS